MNEGVAVVRMLEYWKLFVTVEGCGSVRQWVGTAPLFEGVSLVLDIRGGREVEERERKSECRCGCGCAVGVGRGAVEGV